MSHHDWGVLFDEALLLVIAIFLAVKGLVLRRRTVVGRSIARSNFALSAGYLGAFFGSVLGIELFQTDVWRWGIRSLIAFTLAHAIWNTTWHLGGWKGMWHELVYMLQEFRESWCEWLGMACYQARRITRRR